MKKNKTLGLINLRNKTGKEPTYECGNCHCKRYSPCGCKKKDTK